MVTKERERSSVRAVSREYCRSFRGLNPDRPNFPKHPVLRKPRQPNSLAARPGGSRFVWMASSMRSVTLVIKRSLGQNLTGCPR